ncbi:winged helix-turn-helix domain-containing protein [Actinokineospora sp. G85]|uniref:winged helix-turn-helix domain-containing protein n=1 Tax=Actinokineospora sp. G85 TaxID=3406626 RepID=UPI003C732801
MGAPLSADRLISTEQGFAGRAPTTRITLTLDLTAEAHRVPDLATELASALSRFHPRVSVEPAAPLGVVLPLPRAHLAPLRVLTASRRVLWRGGEVELTRLEFDLLLFLAVRPNRVHRRGALMTEVWGTTYVSERTVDVHVRRIRCKVDPDAPLIRTVRGVGYQFADPELVSVEP